MLAFQPAKLQPAMGRAVARPLGESVPPPGPDPIFTGYTGIPGFVEAALVLTILGAAGWSSFRAASTRDTADRQIVGWIGGVGSALLGLLYLGAKSGLGDRIGLPAVRVTPY